MMKLQDLVDEPISIMSSHKEEALAALEVLGFVRKQAEKVIDKIIKTTSTEFSVEELIKQALKMMT